MNVTGLAKDLTADIASDGTLTFSVDGLAFVRFGPVMHEGVEMVALTPMAPIKPALDFELRLLRLEGPPSPLMSGDKGDPQQTTWNGGGWRRSFVSVALNRAVRGLADGLPALHQWAVDQNQRPLWHWPQTWTYDGYYGRLTNGWKYNTASATGWNVCDPAHLECTPLFSGAAAGDRMSLAQMALLLHWVHRTAYDPVRSRVQRWWRGSDQERAVGWVPWCLARGALLGIGEGDDGKEFRDTFLGGISPKELLIQLARDLVASPPPWGSGGVDDRTMVRISPTEIQGCLSFQNAILLAGWGYVLRTGLIAQKQLSERVKNLIIDRAFDFVNRAVGAGGVCYAFSRHDDFDQADVDLANANETDKTHVYELMSFDGDFGLGVIRDQPRVADAELSAAGLALTLGVDDGTVQKLLALLPKPDNVAAYDDKARYLDPVYALAEVRP